MTNESMTAKSFFKNIHLLSVLSWRSRVKDNGPCRISTAGTERVLSYMILVATERVTVSSFTF